MRTFTIIAALVCLLSACSQPAPDAALKRKADSLEILAKATKMARQMVKMKRSEDSVAYVAPDSLTAAVPKPKIVHNYGPCPVTIKKCAVVNDLRGNGKAIVVHLKNISSKKIASVKLAWTVYNKKDERIGSSTGMAKKDLAKGKTASYSWGINAPSGIRGKATVAAIKYKDGTEWRAEM